MHGSDPVIVSALLDSSQRAAQTMITSQTIVKMRSKEKPQTKPQPLYHVAVKEVPLYCTLLFTLRLDSLCFG